MTIHVSATTGCNLGCTYSAIAGSRVLTADLNWVPIEELDLDDEVVCFDRPEQTDTNEHQKLRTSDVTATYKYKEDAVQIATDSGTITVGESHPLLTRTHGFRDASEFKEGQQIRFLSEPKNLSDTHSYKRGYIAGAFDGDGSIGKSNEQCWVDLRSNDEQMVKYVADNLPFELSYRENNKQHYIGTHSSEIFGEVVSYIREEPDNFEVDDYARGYLAGIFDADGTFDGNVLRFTQEKSLQRDIICEWLEHLSFDFKAEESAIRVYGSSPIELLTEIRPKVSRKVKNFEGHSWNGTATVKSVEYVGERVFYDITVDTYHTLFLEGFASHNCYENPSRERKQEWVDRQYDIEKIMEELEHWKEMYPNEMPGMHGGEPLLVQKDDLERIFSWIHENYDTEERKSHIQTNATLMDEDHIEMFEKYNVHVGVSCDGPPKLNRLRKVAGEKEIDQTDATDMATEETHDAIEKLVESDASVGIITVLNTQNAGTDEKLEVLHSWMDYLTRHGVSGHFNPAIPYEDVQTDVSLSPERLKEVYLETWEWMKAEPYRTWGPHNDYVDNLLGNSVKNCVNNKCDVGNAGAAKIIKGNGEKTGCGKTWSAYGDGSPFLQGESSDNEYNNSDERYEMLKEKPGPHTNGDAPDLGGCKGCKYWNVCTGGCPSSGMDYDYRNRTIWCEAKYALYEQVESDLRALLPNITLITDFRWDDELHDKAQSWQLDIKPFSALDPGESGKSSASHGYEHEHGEPRSRIPDELKAEQTWEEKKDYWRELVGDEEIEIDEETRTIRTGDAAKDEWRKVNE